MHDLHTLTHDETRLRMTSVLDVNSYLGILFLRYCKVDIFRFYYFQLTGRSGRFEKRWWKEAAEIRRSATTSTYTSTKSLVKDSFLVVTDCLNKKT